MQELMSAPFVIQYDYKRTPGPVVGAFFDELRRRKITGVRTRSGRVLCPPQEYDPESGEATLPDPVPVGPEGTVLVACAGWALIRVDGADSAMVHKVEGEPRPGQRVSPVWADEPTGAITDIRCWRV